MSLRKEKRNCLKYIKLCRSNCLNRNRHFWLVHFKPAACSFKSLKETFRLSSYLIRSCDYLLPNFITIFYNLLRDISLL